MMRSRVLRLLSGVFLSLFLLGGCGGGNKPPVDQSKIIVFGTTVGDFGDMVKEAIKPALEKKGYQVKLIEFTDYVPVNKNLVDKNIDINIFQHRPYLQYFIKEHHYPLLDIFEVPTASLGLYSGKETSLSTKKSPLTIAIPNDPVNLDRSLLLLQQIGLLKVGSPKGEDGLLTQKDIISFSRPIKIVELDAAQLPRSRQDVDFSIINGNYAKSSGIDVNSALEHEKSKKYINVAVIRPEDKDSRWVKDVTEAYNSPEFKVYSYRKFKGYNFPGLWSSPAKK